jgi:hypothetical protein
MNEEKSKLSEFWNKFAPLWSDEELPTTRGVTKKPHNFKKAKRRLKMKKRSRRINRHKKGKRKMK